MRERPVVIGCAEEKLVGILHTTEGSSNTGIVIVVGGPQYRVGSHRQFVAMARQFAAAGIPVLRFDFRGMGDSEGLPRSFDEVDEDIRAAIDRLTAEVPGLERVILLGLCDAASAILMYCTSDDRVSGLILINPWVRTAASEAKSYLKHYYVQRLFQKSFWRKFLLGQFSPLKSAREFLQSVKNARKLGGEETSDSVAQKHGFISRMLNRLQQYREPILLLISGRDLTAQEFMDLSRDDRRWAKALARKNIVSARFPSADHTMSSRDDLDAACARCLGWLKSP